jgi:hypothetical protein
MRRPGDAGTAFERMAEWIAVGQNGDRDTARAGLERLWAQEARTDPVTRCGIAHALADVAANPHDELRWDMRALSSALSATDDDAAAHGIAGGTSSLMPSLYLNLADGYRRLGVAAAAMRFARSTQRALAEVEPNPYFDMVAEAVERVIGKLDRGDTS